MVVPTSTKTRLLEIHRSGKYAVVGADKLDEFYNLCHNYLQIHTSTSSTLSEFEYCNLLELFFFLALQTSHDIEADRVLRKLSDKFELSKSERLVILRSIYIEATDSAQSALTYLQESKKLMTINGEPDDLLNFQRRELVLQRAVAKSVKDYVKKLVAFLESHPLDVATWSELSDRYYELGEISKAIYCLQEILLMLPFAFNVYAKVGELYYVQYLAAEKTISQNSSTKTNKTLVDLKDLSVKYFSRSVELCSNYARGWCGLHQIASKAVSNLEKIETKAEFERDKKLLDLAVYNISKNEWTTNEGLKLWADSLVNHN